MSINFRVHLTGSKNVSLDFETYGNSYVKLFEDSLVDAIQNSSLRHPYKVYNFSDQQIEIKEQIDKINTTIDIINSSKSDTFIDRKINYETYADDVNYVHTHFVDSHVSDIDGEAFGDLNNHLHGLEILQSPRQNNNAIGQIYLDFHNKKFFDMPEEALKNFTISRKYGECYVNYCQIGRHIFEMFNNQDEHAHDDHIIPLNRISGSTYIWLGPNTGFETFKQKTKQLEEWFTTNNISEKIGMKWGDPKLAIGWLPVGRMTTNISYQDLLEINEIKKVDYLDKTS